MEAEAATGGWWIAGIAGGMSCCVWSVMLIYNIGALIGAFRDTSDEAASGLSKTAWAISFLSLLLGPCAWLGAVFALVLANFERSRIFKDKSPFASASPCRHASINSGFTLVIWFIASLGILLQFLL